MSLAIQHLYQHIALEDKRLYEALNAIVRALGGTSVSAGTAISTFICNSSPHQVPVVPVVNGADLLLIPIQDATGGRILTYDTNYYKDGPTAIYGTPNTRSVIGFVGVEGKWQWDGRWLTGLPL